MENNSLLIKLTKNKIAFVILLILIISSSIVSNYVNNIIFLEFAPKFVIKAIRLDEKPTKIIPFNRLDSYGIQTIFDSTNGVQISYQIYTEMRQLITIYDTDNVEYGSNYYRLKFDFPDKTEGPRSIPIPLMIISFVFSLLSLIAIIIIAIILIVNALKIIRRAGIL